MNNGNCQRNRDYVRFYPQVDTGWELYVPVDAETADDLLEETFVVLEQVCEALGGFFSPTGLKYTAHYGNGDGDLGALLELEDGEMERIDVKNGQSTSRLISKLRTKIESIDSLVWLALIQIDRGWTKIRLSDGDHQIDVDSDRYKRDSAALQTDRPPTSEPLTVNVFTDLRHSPPHYEVIIWTNTDIWFEDTEIGAVNRARLGDGFRRIRDNLDVTEFGFYSESYSARWLRDQGFHEIAPDE